MNDLVPIARALLSVSDKDGIVEFARALTDRNIEIISTGGTAATLTNAGVPVTPIERVTGLAEMLDGRVKTLHPAIHAGLLARRDSADHTEAMQRNHFAPIDLVCVNLYPFERTIATPGTTRDEAIEQIDIGGPAMIRSAAKNHAWVTVVTDPAQYRSVLDELRAQEGSISLALRRTLALQAFARTSAYDGTIASYLIGDDTAASDRALPEVLTRSWTRLAPLRYGENPHQGAALYREHPPVTNTIVGAKQLHGKPLSYNNIADAAAALELIRALDGLDSGARVAACVVKHANPCGCALAPSPAHAIDAAIAGDPLAAFGGIVACTTPIDDDAAKRLARPGGFFEVIVAPSFEPEALDRLRARWKHVRLLEVGPIEHAPASAIELRTIPGGVLAQQRDLHRANPSAWTHAAGPPPSDRDLDAAAMLDAVVRSLTSNAIALGTIDGGCIQLVGAGAGQMDRVAACRLAVDRAGNRARGAIATSDAFFPFSDGPGVLIDAGVRLIVQPGGSRRDDETIDLCEASGITLLMTGVRRFRH